MASDGASLWRCVSCGAESSDRKPPCHCFTGLVYDPTDTSKVEPVAWHEWKEVGDRRWCDQCGSFQVRTRGRWKDAMVGPYPSYSRTDMAMHRDNITSAEQKP